MACTVDSVNGGLQASGLCRETDPIKLLQLTAQALANRLLVLFPGTNVTPEAILVRACASGIGKIQDPTLLQKAFAQSVCNGFPIPVPPDPYDGILYYTRTGLPPVTVVNPTGAFVLTNAANPVIEIHCHNCPNITSLTCNDSAVLTNVDLYNLPAVTAVAFINDDALTALDLSSFTSLALLNVLENQVMASLNLAALMTVGTLNVYDNPALVALSAPQLTTATEINFWANVGMTTLSLPALTTVAKMFGYTCSTLVTINFAALRSVVAVFNLANSPTVPGVSWPSYSTAMPDQYVVDADPACTNVFFNNRPLKNGMLFSAPGCALPQAAVDMVLAAGVAGGMTSGTIDLTGGTNSVPSATGLANKNTLVAAGVTVLTN